MDKRKALGRGLDSLLPSGPRVISSSPQPAPISDGALAREIAPVASGHDTVQEIALDSIDKNPYQTRLEFAEEPLKALAESIKASGLAQPIVVRPGEAGRFVLVLGERRCRASKLAGKATIMAIVRRVSDQQAAEMTVVENLQRQDLNCMEQAAAFSKLSRTFGLTQEEIGKRVGVSRESVSNYMRLLKLPPAIAQFLTNGSLAFSDAKALLQLDDDPDAMLKAAEEAVKKQMSSHQVNALVADIMARKYALDPQQPAQGAARWVDPNVRAIQTELQRVLGTRVKVSDRKGKGKIVIEYSTIDDFDRVIEMLMGKKAAAR
jgi:ParB family transcriptional regulator, chromosome partitioning protein